METPVSKIALEDSSSISLIIVIGRSRTASYPGTFSRLLRFPLKNSPKQKFLFYVGMVGMSYPTESFGYPLFRDCANYFTCR